jgi:hypothetical protein
MIWEAIGAIDHSILDKPIAKGVITQSLFDSFTQSIMIETRTLAHHSRNPPFVTEDTIGLATAALTSAIYQEVWKPRTSYIFSENSKLQYEKKQQEWKQEKANKKERSEATKKAKKEQRESNKTHKKKEKPVTTPQHLNQKRDIKKATSKRTTQKHKERKALASTVPKKKIKTTQVEPHNPVAITQSGNPRPKRTSTELAREISTRPKKKRKKEPPEGL